jgi:hypothetical protein
MTIRDATIVIGLAATWLLYEMIMYHVVEFPPPWIQRIKNGSRQ